MSEPSGRSFERPTPDARPRQRSGSRRRLNSVLLVAASLIACGEHGALPTSVERGPDFQIAEVVFDANFFYCRVEPELFASSCGPGDSGQDPANGCHFSVTPFRLSDYSPLLADTCNGGVVPGGPPTPAAQRNYTVAQAHMDRDLDRAQLYTRPLAIARHPRKIFDSDSSAALAIKQWADQFSTQ
jgi:hypothetical protein